MRVGKLSDDVCNGLDPEIMIQITILNIPWCVDNAPQHFTEVHEDKPSTKHDYYICKLTGTVACTYMEMFYVIA
jgi:hypothetical protein